LNTHEDSSKIYALSIGNGGDGSLNFNATMTPEKKSNNQTSEDNLYSWKHFLESLIITTNEVLNILNFHIICIVIHTFK
jgi:hypothetical protein